MYLDTFIKRAPSYLDRGICVYLKSDPGVGKSDAVRYLRDWLSERDKDEWGLSTNMLGLMSPQDVMGFMMGVPKKIKGPDGKLRDTLVSEFSLPPWMMSDSGIPMNDYKHGIVFFDEDDKADIDTYKASGEPKLHGRAGRHQLHKGIGVICAANDSGRSGSRRLLDFMVNRVMEITIKPHLGSWLTWAHRKRIPALFIAYAQEHPDVVFHAKQPEKIEPWCTPRSYVRYIDLLQHDYCDASGLLRIDDDNRATVLEEGAGTVGVAACEDILNWCRIQSDIPSVADILANPAGTPVPPVEHPDRAMLLSYMLVEASAKPTMDAVVTYMLRLPQEFHTTYAMALVKRDPTLVMHSAFNKKLAGQNANLVRQLQQYA